MATEDLSIVIPTKQEEAFLPKLLDSIRTQDCQPREILVADAFSADRTRKIALAYQCKLIDGGPLAEARNKAATHCQSDLILFIDADLQLPPGFLKSALTEFHQRNLDVAGTLQVLEATSNAFVDFAHHVFFGVANCAMMFFQRTPKPYMQTCMFAKKKVHEAIGGFDETLIFGEDSEYAVRACKIARFGILNTPQRVIVSPRRFQRDGLSLALKYLYLNVGRLLGFEFRKQSKLVNYHYGDYNVPPAVAQASLPPNRLREVPTPGIISGVGECAVQCDSRQ